MKTEIKKFGIEIEGEYTLPFMEICRQFGTIKGDGSVNRCRDRACGDNLTCAEFASKAIGIDDNDTIEKIFGAFQVAFKAKHYHFNPSAGFHIHLSFTPELPPEIFSAEFAQFFMNALEKDQKEVVKMRGNNQYCRMRFEEREIAYGGSDRYRFINFWPAFEKHRTIEFRIWPTNEPDKMLEYFRFTLAKVREFLATPYKRTESLTVRQLADVNEEFTERVTARTYKMPLIKEQVALFEPELF